MQRLYSYLSDHDSIRQINCWPYGLTLHCTRNCTDITNTSWNKHMIFHHGSSDEDQLLIYCIVQVSCWPNVCSVSELLSCITEAYTRTTHMITWSVTWWLHQWMACIHDCHPDIVYPSSHHSERGGYSSYSMWSTADVTDSTSGIEYQFITYVAM